MKKRLSVKQGLIASSVAVSGILLFAIAVLANGWNRTNEYNKIDAFLLSETGAIVPSISTFFPEEDEKKLAEKVVSAEYRAFLDTFFKRRLDRRVPYKTTLAVFDQKFRVINVSNSAVPIVDVPGQSIAKNVELDQDNEGTLYTATFGDADYRLVDKKILIGSIVVGAIRLGCSMETVNRALRDFTVLLWLIVLVVFVIVALTAVVLVGKTLGRVNEISHAAESITEKNLNQKLPIPPGNDELSQLSVTFNLLLDRLRNAYEQRGRLVEDLSHELKTPLTILRANIDLALRSETSKEKYKTLVEDCLVEIDYLVSFIHTILHLTRLEKGMTKPQKEKADIVSFTKNLIQDLNPLLSAKDVRMQYKFAPDRVDLSGGWILDFDAMLLKQALLNVLTNGVEHCPVGGTLQVQFSRRSEADAQWFCVEVWNNGPAIEESALDHVFERFFRADGSGPREGFGLGLNIALNAMELQGGTIRAYNPPRGGAAFEIALRDRA